jgi:hypothetical protein
MGRADGLDHQRARRASHPRRTCRPRPWPRRPAGEPAPHRGPTGHQGSSAALPRRDHRGDDAAIAGAAAEDAAQRRFHLALRGRGGCGPEARPPSAACPACRCRIAPRRGAGRLARRRVSSGVFALDRRDLGARDPAAGVRQAQTARPSTAPCRPRNRPRRSRPWCRPCPAVRAASATAVRSAAPRPRRSTPFRHKADHASAPATARRTSSTAAARR